MIFAPTISENAPGSRSAIMKFGEPDAQFLEEIRHIINPGDLERILQRLKTANSLIEVRALYTPPEELALESEP